MFKFITAFGANSFSVAGLFQDAHPSDTESFRFAFVIYNVTVKEFCDAINNLYSNSQNPEKYIQYDDVVIRTLNPRDNTRITREGYSLYITRGNLRVVYSGWIKDMYNLCKQLETDYQAYIKTKE